MASAGGNWGKTKKGIKFFKSAGESRGSALNRSKRNAASAQARAAFGKRFG